MCGVRFYLPVRFSPISPPCPPHGLNLPDTACQAVFAPYLHTLGFPEIGTHIHECLMTPD
jgi:hypothetical protein